MGQFVHFFKNLSIVFSFIIVSACGEMSSRQNGVRIKEGNGKNGSKEESSSSSESERSSEKKGINENVIKYLDQDQGYMQVLREQFFSYGLEVDLSMYSNSIISFEEKTYIINFNQDNGTCCLKGNEAEIQGIDTQIGNICAFISNRGGTIQLGDNVARYGLPFAWSYIEHGGSAKLFSNISFNENAKIDVKIKASVEFIEFNGQNYSFKELPSELIAFMITLKPTNFNILIENTDKDHTIQNVFIDEIEDFDACFNIFKILFKTKNSTLKKSKKDMKISWQQDGSRYSLVFYK
jgi:hypothetical protein